MTRPPEPQFTKQAAIESAVSSVVIDCYDDAFIEKQAEFPGFVKNSPRLTQDELSALPDAAFAVVILDRRGSVHRKWPLIDPGHIWMAAHYWHGTKGVVPDAVRKTAAHYILDAAKMHGMMLQSELPHRSELETTCAGLDAPPATNVINARAMQTSYSDMTRSDEPAFQHSIYKSAEATEEEEDEGKRLLRQAREAEKRAIYALMGGTEKRAEPRYPIHTRSLWKQAVAYFEQHENQLPFEDRFEYADNVCKLAQVYGESVPDCLAKYASCGYAGHTVPSIRSRLEYTNSPTWPENGEAVVEKIAEIASEELMPPASAMRLLEAFDKRAGLQPYWHKRLPDPARCFAAGHFKLAARDGIGVLDGDLVSHSVVKTALDRHGSLLQEVYGSETVEKLAEPATASVAFESLPVEHRRRLVVLGQAG